MRKHILTYYVDKTQKVYSEVCGITMETRVTEDSDPDDFMVETAKALKNDSNSFELLDPTIITEQIENSDPDGFTASETTKLTFTKEDSDPDDFFDVLGEMNDFDDILILF